MTLASDLLHSFQTGAKGTRKSEALSESLKSSSVELDHQMQKAMLVAAELLGMFRRLHRDPIYSRWIGEEIAQVVGWMVFLIEQREHMGRGAPEQKPERVNISARVVCHDCGSKAREDTFSSSSRRELSRPARPAWQKQVEFMLACSKRVASEIFEQGSASSTLQPFPDCLARLIRVLLRYERSLACTGFGNTQLAVEHRSDNCGVCGRPIDVAREAVPESASDQVSRKDES